MPWRRREWLSKPENGAGGAASRLERQPYDLYVNLRLATDGTMAIRQVRISYTEKGRVSEFVFDATDPAFGGDREEFLEAAFAALLAEVKSRVVAQDPFTVWFRSEDECALAEQRTAAVVGTEANAARFIAELRSRSRIIQLE